MQVCVCIQDPTKVKGEEECNPGSEEGGSTVWLFCVLTDFLAPELSGKLLNIQQILILLKYTDPILTKVKRPM